MCRFRSLWRTVHIAAVFALLFAAPDAEAQKKRKKKAVAAPDTSSGPALKYEQFRRQVQLKVARKREQQIEGLKRLLEYGPAPEEIPDIEFRLAELYYEKSQDYFFRAQQAHDDFSKGKTPQERQRHLNEKKRLERHAQKWSRQATKLYQSIRRRHAGYPRMPEVLFALGQSYWTAGQRDESIEVYTDLIRGYPDSPMVADAWLVFGEYYFAEGALHRIGCFSWDAKAEKVDEIYRAAVASCVSQFPITCK